MRYLSLVVAAIFVMWAGYCGAQDTKNTAPVVGEKSDEMAVPADTAEDSDVGEREDSGVGRENLMPPGQTYDENTGMPNTVESDTDGEIE